MTKRLWKQIFFSFVVLLFFPSNYYSLGWKQLISLSFYESSGENEINILHCVNSWINALDLPPNEEEKKKHWKQSKLKQLRISKNDIKSEMLNIQSQSLIQFIFDLSCCHKLEVYSGYYLFILEEYYLYLTCNITFLWTQFKLVFTSRQFLV